MRCGRPSLAGLVISALLWPFSVWGGSYILVVPADTANTGDAYLREDDSDQINGDKNQLRLKNDTAGKSRTVVIRPDLSPRAGFTILDCKFRASRFEQKEARRA